MRFLQQVGFRTLLAKDFSGWGEDEGPAAASVLLLAHPDPKLVCTTLRARGVHLPILVLAAAGASVVPLLEAGADDAVRPPVTPDEVAARLRALLRGRRWARIADPPCLHLGDVKVVGRTVTRCDGTVVQLTYLERELLRVLAEAGGRCLSRAEIARLAWGRSLEHSRTIDNFVLRLRRVLEEDPNRPCHLLTVRGRGYLLRRDPADLDGDAGNVPDPG